MNKILKTLWFHSIGIQKEFIRIFTHFVPHKDRRRIRRDMIARTKKRYLSQYLYSINNEDFKDPITPDTEKYLNNTVWILWLQGEENAPDIVKVCMKYAKKFKPDGMNVKIVREEDLDKLIKIPDYIYKKWKDKKISNIHFSDIIRVCLLDKYGGVWLDSTVLLTDKIPEDILKADFFALTGQGHLKNNNWFLKSNPNHILIKSIKKYLFEYWKQENKLFDYFIYHLFFDLMLERNENLMEEWKKIPIYYEEDCYDFGDVYLFKPYDEKIFNEVLKKTTFHKLKYKYDKKKKIEGTFLEKILSL